MVKAIGYCRVSTENQKKEMTIRIQEENIKDFSKKNDFNLVKIFQDEAINGGLQDRPGLSELFNFVEADGNIKTLIIFKLDRLARDLYIQEHLIKKFEGLGLKLISINEPDLDSKDPMRKAFRQFMGIVSELEKAFITMRLSSGRISKAKKGGYAGGTTALGYVAKNRELEINQEEAEIVKKIYYLKRYKKLSLGKIAKQLNESNIPTKRGKKWYSATVKFILERGIYRGNYNYKGYKSIKEGLRLL